MTDGYLTMTNDVWMDQIDDLKGNPLTFSPRFAEYIVVAQE